MLRDLLPLEREKMVENYVHDSESLEKLLGKEFVEKVKDRRSKILYMSELGNRRMSLKTNSKIINGIEK